MLQPRFVRQLLFEVAGLRQPAAAAERTGTEPADAVEAELRADQRHEIETARKRAFAVVVLDAVAVLALLVLRDPSRGLLELSRSQEVLFTLGVLAVAAHAGFRLAQAMVLRNLERAWEELPREASSR